MSLPLSVYRRMPRQLPLSLGFSRYSLSFNGDDYVEVPHTDMFNIGLTGELTVCVWAYPRTAGDKWRAVITKNRESASESDWYGIWASCGTPSYWHFRSGTGILSTTEIELNKWAFLGMVARRGGTVECYVNGELKGTFNDGSTDADYALRIGHAGGTDEYFDGIIDEILIYGRVLSEHEVRYNMLNYHNPIRDGLVLWLPLEEGTGTTVYDKSGYGNDGAIYGATWTRVKMWELRAEVGL